ncbi:cell division protein ZipA [Pseudoalteromonas sp. T1lg75]|uniref:cell division protein ZipA n=1 Tax=Pseudoalteromonas sp. T1lg75 TaxID=2077102 RepID=UPI000CF73199|nr:cell division protein ZipA [Pseudoalteromonas sp. T1lg75]
MAEDLRWVLILISAVVIGGLLIHGLWSVRKRSQGVDNSAATKTKAPAQEQQKAASSEAPGATSHVASEPVKASEQVPTSTTSDTSATAEAASAAAGTSTSASASPSLHTDVREEPSFNALDDEEPNLGNFAIEDDEQTDVGEKPQQESSAQPSAKPSAVQPEDFVIIHVHMPEGLQMQGAKLLPLVLTLGFKYSDDGFFHRHEQSSGQGPVLFRMVNMYNPGTFDIDNMEQFSTAGISLFMTLPNEGEAMTTFNMLHSAAKKLAEEFGAELLDHNRQPLSVNGIREYVEKVREYA